MGKPTICIGENKGTDQLRSNCEAYPHPVNKVYMGGDNLRLSVNCLYGYVLENFELSHR